MLSLILHGRKSLELQRWRNLRFPVNPLQNASPFSSASAAADNPLQDVQKGDNFTVSTYLIESLGFTTKLAESISKKITFDEKANPRSVLSLLRRYKFTDSQISSIITNYPSLLTLDADTSLSPKLKLLQSRGASTSELTEILSKVPKILKIRKEQTLIRYYDFVREIVQADKSELQVSLLPNGPNRIRNVFALRQLGMPQDLLFPLLVSENGTVHGRVRFQESLRKVLEMGFDPTTAKFVQALRMLYQMSEKTIEDKIKVYKRLGLSVEDVWEMFKKWPTLMTNSEKKITQTFETFSKCGLVEEEIVFAFKKFPQCIGASEHNCLETFLGLGFSKDEVAVMVKRLPLCIGYSAEMVKRKTEFVVGEMKWPLKAVVSYPAVLGLSMEKRVVPRCDVIKTLVSRGLLGGGSEPPPVGSMLACTDELFLRRYVRKHDDDEELVAELMAILRGRRASTR